VVNRFMIAPLELIFTCAGRRRRWFAVGKLSSAPHGNWQANSSRSASIRS